MSTKTLRAGVLTAVLAVSAAFVAPSASAAPFDLAGWATQGGGTTGGGSAAATTVTSASALTTRARRPPAPR